MEGVPPYSTYRIKYIGQAGSKLLLSFLGNIFLIGLNSQQKLWSFEVCSFKTKMAALKKVLLTSFAASQVMVAGEE